MAGALALIYPSQCLACGDMVEGDGGICAACWRGTPFVDGAVCDCCGVPLLGGDPSDRDLCDTCLAERPPWSQGRAALLYRDAARRLVLSLKNGGREDIAAAAASWMAHAGREVIKPGMVLVPVPLHWLRMVQRRYNQAALLAQALEQVTGCETMLDALKRPVNTKRLERLTTDERRAVMAEAIQPNPKRSLRGRDVLLIDDVMTTGATLAAATRAATQAGARRVDVLTLARTARDP